MTLRLLIADDNAAIQKMVRLAFAGEDAFVEAVSSGDAALGILKDFRPDVVLADVSMPGYSGYEVCELIRHEPEFADVPVILLSGAFDPFDEEEATRVKASGHLTKPFDPSEMIALVESLLPETARHSAPDFSDNEKKEVFAGTDIAAEISSPPFEYVVAGAPGDFFSITPGAWESYLGPDRILEIFHDETFNGKTAADRRIPEELIERVAEKVMEKMFPDIETFIRQMLSARKTT